MKFQNRRKWQIIRQYIVGWTFAFLFLSLILGSGREEIGSVKFEFWKAILVSFVWGSIFGAISGYAQILTEERGYKKISIQRLLLLRIVFVLLFLITFITVAYLLFGQDISFVDFALEPEGLGIYTYILAVDIFMFVFRQVSLFLGSGNLWKLFRGKFYEPREEERIFMFLDLQSSTTHAERLGHIQYSKLIQDCFSDLGVVVENEAEIYQYVGDEVILTWKLKDGLRKQNCLRAYYNFKNQLLKREEHYQQHYNCTPHFKAGLNAGIVTVTEVGKYKKEIAYHGDTINIAARIQGKCNELGKELLLSGYLKDLLTGTDFSFDELGSVDLKGKAQKVALYAVTQPE